MPVFSPENNAAAVTHLAASVHRMAATFPVLTILPRRAAAGVRKTYTLLASEVQHKS